jgi:hypothetical protein
MLTNLLIEESNVLTTNLLSDPLTNAFDDKSIGINKRTSKTWGAPRRGAPQVFGFLV